MKNSVFSARYRGIRVFVYLCSLAALILYGRVHFPYVTLQMCLSRPEFYDGTKISVGNEATVRDVYKDGFIIEQLGKQVRVSAPDVHVASGEFVYLHAVFFKPDSLHALKVRVAKKRRAKIWLSVFPVLLIGAYFFHRFRFNVKTFYFEERRSCQIL
ncbi:hypothetical protein EH223_00645 [candidate division KSB1 bacterium]|nr:MAG: hypothetical protein EH223_00645 [candidate division KSB1 bacterium]